MTVRELIEGLLDFPMDATVRLSINEEHEDEHGEKCLGYMFDIDKMESWGVSCLLTFTDWRKGLADGKADRPQGEWIDAEIPLESGDTMPIQVCNLCKTFYLLAYTGGGHRFCPNCGARMKGADDGEDIQSEAE